MQASGGDLPAQVAHDSRVRDKDNERVWTCSGEGSEKSWFPNKQESRKGTSQVGESNDRRKHFWKHLIENSSQKRFLINPYGKN